MAYATEVSLRNITFTDRAIALWGTVKDNLAKRSAYRRTVKELGALSSAELNDLGLNRSMIHQIAYETTYGV